MADDRLMKIKLAKADLVSAYRRLESAERALEGCGVDGVLGVLDRSKAEAATAYTRLVSCGDVGPMPPMPGEGVETTAVKMDRDGMCRGHLFADSSANCSRCSACDYTVDFRDVQAALGRDSYWVHRPVVRG